MSEEQASDGGLPIKPFQCGANKKGGGLCRHQKARGRSRCKFHGGNNVVGVDSPAFRTGRYSKFFPEKLLDRYHEAIDDPDLLSLRDDIGVLQVRVAELIERLNTGEAGGIWKRLNQAWSEFEQALSSGKQGPIDAAIENIGQLIKDGKGYEDNWRDLAAAIRDKAATQKDEWKRLIDLQQTITAEKALVLVAQLTEAVRAEITDREILKRITNQFALITSRSSEEEE